MSDLSSIERLKFEALFGMESGYVLDFSNNTFSMFTVENVGINIFDRKYEFESSSKANRLRKFWIEEPNEIVGTLLLALLDYWHTKKQIKGEDLSHQEKKLYDECRKISHRLQKISSVPPEKNRNEANIVTTQVINTNAFEKPVAEKNLKEANPQNKKRKPVKTEYVVALIGAVATIIAALLGSPLIEKWVNATPEFTPVVSASPSSTSLPSSTSTPLSNDTPSATLQATVSSVLPTISNTKTQIPEATSTKTPTPIVEYSVDTAMVFVPAGFFDMYDDNEYVKKYVNGFYIDQHEITYSQYEKCVNAGICSAPHTNVAPEYSNVMHYGDKSYSSYPVVLVSWNMAQTYCMWRGDGGRLPTNAEWEKAARGYLLNQAFPWGDESPTCEEGTSNGANFMACNSNDVFPIMQFLPNGYGLFDMAGNVSEWVDTQDETYKNRGGSWLSSSEMIKIEASFESSSPRDGFVDVGFRCAKDAP